MFAERKNKVQPSNFLSIHPTVLYVHRKEGVQVKTKVPTQLFNRIRLLIVLDSDMVVNEDETVHNIVIHSLNSDRFSNLEVALVFVCTICCAVPCEPVITNCSYLVGHLVSPLVCRGSWMSTANALLLMPQWQCISSFVFYIFHTFRKEYIHGWLSRSAACPVCRDKVEGSEVSVLQGQLLQIYESLTLRGRPFDSEGGGPGTFWK